MEKRITEGYFGKFNVFSGICLYFAIMGLIAGFAITLSGGNEDGTEFGILIGFVAFFVFCGVAYFLYSALNKCEIIVTDKRVSGKAIFNKRVDLPFDMISSVSMCAFKGIGVSTSSGQIKFLFCKNKNEVFNAISNQLINRQEKKPEQKEKTIIQNIPQSNADEIKKYKDLLDSGIITHEEFEAKKRQLLGL